MVVRGRLRAVGVALAVVLGLVGCNGSDPDEGERSPATRPEAERTVPAGYIDVKDAETGFSVAVPQDWQQLPFNAETLQQQADAVRMQNPRMADALSSAKDLIGGRGKLFVIHPDGRSTVNLIVSPTEGVSLEDFPTRAIGEFRRRGATLLSQERTSLGGTDAVKLTMKVPLDAQTTVDQVQYYALREGKAFVLTLTGSDPALDVIVSSFRLT